MPQTYTDAERLEMALRDAQRLINSLVNKIDWEPIPGTYARDCARIRNNIQKVLLECSTIQT